MVRNIAPEIDMIPMSRVILDSENSVETATDEAYVAASVLGFTAIQTSYLISAVSEIATNVIRYAGSGLYEIGRTPNNLGIEVSIRDDGPGITDVARSVVDGFSSSGESLGLGLGAARRAVEYFHISTEEGRGTCVTMRTYRTIPTGMYEVGVASRRSPRHIGCRERILVKELEGSKVFVALVDGGGAGPDAHRTATEITQCIEENLSCDLEYTYRQISRSPGVPKMYGVDGLLLGLIDSTAFHFVQFGDIHYRIIGSAAAAESRSVREDLSGTRERPISGVSQMAPSDTEPCLVVLHTDGIAAGWKLMAADSDACPQDVADLITAEHSAVDEDASCIVVRAGGAL